MLVLERGVEEVICIGDDIKVMPTRIRYRSVRLGIEAPLDIRILRDNSICMVEAPQPPVQVFRAIRNGVECRGAIIRLHGDAGYLVSADDGFSAVLPSVESMAACGFVSVHRRTRELQRAAS